jgi:hypothetical protein
MSKNIIYLLDHPRTASYPLLAKVGMKGRSFSAASGLSFRTGKSLIVIIYIIKVRIISLLANDLTQIRKFLIGF